MRFFSFLFLHFAIATQLFSQELSVKFLDISDGLSNNSVITIYQDDDGFMWFGTYDGLNRYDGYSFKVFRNRINDPKSLSFNTIYNIEGDAHNNIWIGGATGLCIYSKKSGQFHGVTYKADTQPQVRPLKDIIHQTLTISKDLVLVASQHLGLLVYKNGSFAGERIKLSNGFINSKITNYDVSGIQYDQNTKKCWVYVRNVGLCTYDITKKILLTKYKISKDVKTMAIDKDGKLWLGTDEGLFNVNLNTGKLSDNFLDSKFSVTNVFIDKKRSVWATTDGYGIFKLDLNSKRALPFSENNNGQLIKSNSVWSLYEDRTGNKWIGTLRGGITMISNKQKLFKTVRADSKNPADNFILSFCEMDENNVWVGTDGAGLKLWNRDTNKLLSYSTKTSSPFITGIVKGPGNVLWCSTWAGGINKIDTNSKIVTTYDCFNTVTNQVEKNIWLLYKDSSGKIWASATNEGTLYYLDTKLDKFILFNSKIKNLQSLIETKDGTLWGGNYANIYSINPKNRKVNEYKIGNPVRCILEDSKKNLWLGTQEGGLLLFDKKTHKYKQLTTDDGLPSNTILRLLEDKEQNLWISTYNGISRFDVKLKTFRNFSVNDGLQSNQFSFNAGIQLRSGEILFGGINGFNLFYPKEIKSDTKSSAVLLTDFYVNNQIYSPYNLQENTSGYGTTRMVQLKSDQTTVSLEFVALDFNHPDKIKYAYLLEGWDEQWNLNSESRKANYSRLTEGTYNFKVKTTNYKGGWNNEVNLLKIVILPPWYRSFWAYSFYFLALISLGVVYRNYSRNKAILKFKVKIAQLESKKEKEIAQKQSSMFTYISHEFRTPLSLIINPLKKAVQKEEITKGTSGSELAIAHRNARRLLSLVDQLLLFKKAENDVDSLILTQINANTLCNEVFQCFINQANEKNITYELNVPEHTIDIVGDYEKLEIALFNLMSNAFKHTADKGIITLNLSENATSIEISISDNGEGIAKDNQDVIFEKFKQINSHSSTETGFGIGLYVVKSFVEKHFGSIRCTSELNEGTTFTINLLKGREHFKEFDIVNTMPKRSQLLNEIIMQDQEILEKETSNEPINLNKELLTTKRTVLIVDDNEDIRNYLIALFSDSYKVFSAKNGAEGLKLTQKQLPDLVISDITMAEMDGLELCRLIKENDALSHIPVILLTASKNPETHLQGISDGADDYITKPFDDDILMARVDTLMKNRSNLRKYFLDSITLKENTQKVPVEYQEMLKKCIEIVEANIHKGDFTIKNFALEMGMSHRTLYTKIKIISGQTLNAFIRSVRIRRAAMLLLTQDINIAQASAEVGFEDQKYFRQQFVKLFGMTPSEYIKRYKNSFNADLNVIK